MENGTQHSNYQIPKLIENFHLVMRFPLMIKLKLKCRSETT